MTDKRQPPPRLGKCLFCKVDLDALAAEGKLGHVCSAKPEGHADGSAYESETDADGELRPMNLATALAGRELLRIERDNLRAALNAIGGHLFAFTSGQSNEQVALDRIEREVLQAGGQVAEIDLRAALAEALNGWEACNDRDYTEWRLHGGDDSPRIAELRAKFLGGTKR